jgi:hypothetical protein
MLKKAHDRKNRAAVVSADQWKFTKLPEFLKKRHADIYSANKQVYFIVLHWMLP